MQRQAEALGVSNAVFRSNAGRPCRLTTQAVATSSYQGKRRANNTGIAFGVSHNRRCVWVRFEGCRSVQLVQRHKLDILVEGEWVWAMAVDFPTNKRPGPRNPHRAATDYA